MHKGGSPSIDVLFGIAAGPGRQTDRIAIRRFRALFTIHRLPGLLQQTLIRNNNSAKLHLVRFWRAF
jgi:hypothetical protein